MKAIICTKYGGPEVLKFEEIEKPVPKKKEILVKIIATAVNSGDVRVRGLIVPGFLRFLMRLVLGINKPRKPILGTVLSGVIESVGEKVTKFKPGDEVFAMTGFKFGTYAEYITLNEDAVVTFKPKNASFEEAAAIIFGGSTAIYFLNKAHVGSKPKQKILIYGATGAVGSSAIQIAKKYDTYVTAVCREEGFELAKNLGADEVIFYEQDDFTRNGKKYDIIFDAVGKKSKKECKTSLKSEGTYITVGGLDVAKETIEQLELLRDLFENNKYKAVIDRTYAVSSIVEAHRYVDTGKKKGNVVIKMVY